MAQYIKLLVLGKIENLKRYDNIDKSLKSQDIDIKYQ